MKSLLKYFAKKRLLTVLIITVLLSIISIITVLNTRHLYEDNQRANSTMLTLYGTMITIISFIVPLFEFSFKMNKNTVDAYYSLPIKREKLFLTKYIVGLFEIIIPFTVSYFMMVILVQFVDNKYIDIYFLLYFLEIIASSVLLYSIVSFIYTKANTIFDGIIMVIFYLFIGTLLINDINIIISKLDYFELFIKSNYYYLFSQIDTITFVNNRLLAGLPIQSVYLIGNIIAINSIITVLGILCFFLLIFHNSKEKAENTNDYTESYLGYKIMLPLYTILCLILANGSVILSVFFCVASVFGYFIYNRGFKLNKGKIISLSISLITGIILSIIFFQVL